MAAYFRSRVSMASLACVVLAGCGTQATVTIAPIGTGNGTLAAGGAAVGYSLAQAGNGFVVETFSLASGGSEVVSSALTMPSSFGPTALAVDPGNGTLYVGGVNYVNSTQTPEVLAYAAGASGAAAPQRVIVGTGTTASFGEPISMTVDGAGALYVASAPQDTGAVAIYGATANGAGVPQRVIAGATTGIYQPTQVAVDAAGSLYVSSDYEGYAGNVVEFSSTATGNVPPARAITDNAHVFNGVAVDSFGTVYVLEGTLDSSSAFVTNASVVDYDSRQSGPATPRATLGGNGTGISTASSLEIDSRGNLYVGGRLGSGVGAVRQLLVFGPYVSGSKVPALQISGTAAEAQFLPFSVR